MRYTIVVLASCLLTTGVAALAEEDLRVLSPNALEGPSDDMMSRYLQQQAKSQFEQWRQRYEELKTPEQITAYQKNLRDKFIEAIGGLPAKTPLNPRVTGVVERDGYRVEKVIFESQPKHCVTALLFLPTSGSHKTPFPGVIVPCGHASQAKAYEAHQTMRASLALNGMAALVFGPNTKDVLTAYLLGRSYVGMRAEDILICARLLQEQHKECVDLVAVGDVCVPALHAAALEPGLFRSVRLIRGLTSWSDVVESGLSRNQLVNAVHGALAVYDLPDLVRLLGDRVILEQPLNAQGEPAVKVTTR